MLTFNINSVIFLKIVTRGYDEQFETFWYIP